MENLDFKFLFRLIFIFYPEKYWRVGPNLREETKGSLDKNEYTLIHRQGLGVGFEGSYKTESKVSEVFNWVTPVSQ